MEIICIEHTHDIRGVGESVLLTLTFEMYMFPPKHDYSNYNNTKDAFCHFICLRHVG